jgi:tetratricopeptide (TPR) repeat protein
VNPLRTSFLIGCLFLSAMNFADPESEKDRAAALLAEGHWEEAAQVYDAVIAETPMDSEALHSLGRLYFSQKKYGRARAQFRKAIDAVSVDDNPDLYAKYQMSLGEVFAALRKWGKSAAAYRAALSVRPRNRDARANLGLALIYKTPSDPWRAIAILHPLTTSLRRAEDQNQEFLSQVHNNLGVAYRVIGRNGDALGEFQRSLALFPSAETESNLSETFFYLKRNRLGARHGILAIELENKSADNLVQIGARLQRNGNRTLALKAFNKAIVLDPRSIQAYLKLGYLQQEMNAPGKAEATFRILTDLRPQWALAKVLLGNALQSQQRFQEAADQFHAAIKLEPRGARPWVLLGNWYEQRGQLALAEEAFRKSMEIDPHHLAGLADLAILLKKNLPAEDLAALEKEVTATVGTVTGYRAHLLFCLAQVLDALGQPQRVGQLLNEAHQIKAALRPLTKKSDPRVHTQLVDRLTQVFDKAFFERLAQLPVRGARLSQRPIFIFGMPRSGTTLLEQILASHSQVHGAGELSLAQKTLASFPGFDAEATSPASIDIAGIERLAQTYLDKLSAINSDKPYIVDKMPENYLYIGLLAALFPRATFINARRDFRDIAVSLWITEFAQMHWTHDPAHVLNRFEQYARIMEHWRETLPPGLVKVASYETMVTDSEAAMRDLVEESCGLPWEDQCAQFHTTQRNVQTASVRQVRQPITQQSKERWRRYEQELPELFDALSCIALIAGFR